MNKRINQFQKSIADTISRFGDIRFTGQIIFAIIILLISWSGVRAIQTNYGLQQQVSELEQQNELIKLQNNNIQLQNEYYNSNQYLELSARQNLGLADAGENELLVPSSVALNYTVNLPSTSSTTQVVGQQSNYQTNFESWVDFFLHRNDFQNN